VSNTTHTGFCEKTKTIVLGIGNPILRDDGVGHRLIQELRSRVNNPHIVLEETSAAGLDLMEILTGFDSAIIIDAIQGGGIPGTVHCLKPGDFCVANRDRYLQHGIGLLQALELGERLGQPMPKEVTIVAIEARDTTNFGEGLTPDVERAIPLAVEKILHLLNSRQRPLSRA